ncbi:MAG: protease pro-enzyme activation domain-containing protein [Acidobacteriota bacterium]
MRFRYRQRYLGWGLLVLTISIVGAGFSAAKVGSSCQQNSVAVLVGSAYTPVRHGRLMGQAKPDLLLENLNLILAINQHVALDELIKAQQQPSSPFYHHFLTPSEFAEQFSPPPEHYQALIEWLESEGLQVTHTWNNRLSIAFSGTAAQIETVFGTPINLYQYGEDIYYAAAVDPIIPARFAGLVEAITGLDNYARFKTIAQTGEPTNLVKSQAITGIERRARIGAITGLSPADFQLVYNVKPLLEAGFNGRGQQIAIVARSDFNIEDVRAFRDRFNLPVAEPEKIFVGANPGILSNDELIEVLLDTQWAGAVAAGAEIKVVIAERGRDIDQSLTLAVNDNIAPIISVSFQLCERNLGEANLRSLSNIYAQAAVQGQTIFVASGNFGADGCADGSGAAINGLASNPNVTAVGGTRLDAKFDSDAKATGYGGESVWNDGLGMGATGGGASLVFPKPTYQLGTSTLKDNKRNIPDVALLASPQNPGYLIVVQGSVRLVGGTSVSAPCWAGLFAIVNQARNGRQGLANPEIYRLGANQILAGGIAVYHDITSGNTTFNGVNGNAATIGYDLATGWGSFDAELFVRNFGFSVSAINTSVTEINYGRINFGDTADTRPITIRNNSDKTITIHSIRLSSGDQVKGFTVTRPPTAFTLAPAMTKTFSINYRAAVSGEITGLVTIISDARGGTALQIPLKVNVPSNTVEPPKVNLTNPVGREIIPSGGMINIRWKASDDGQIVSQSLMLSINSGASYDIVIANGLAGSVRNFNFTLPDNIATTRARVRITVTDNDGKQGQSENIQDFSIVDRISPRVSVQSPGAGKVIPAGGLSNINWMASDNISVAKQEIHLSLDGGKNFTEKIATNLDGNVRVESFIAPSRTIAQAVIRIIARDAVGNGGVGDSATFTIAPQLTGGKFSSKQLFITGAGLDGEVAVIINSQAVIAKRIKERTPTSLTLRGVRKRLNLRAGDNTVQVRINGILSNTLIISLE